MKKSADMVAQTGNLSTQKEDVGRLWVESSLDYT